VGWLLAHAESATLASELIAESCRKQGISPGQLTAHADRGGSMRSRTVAQLLSNLGVEKTHSRPHVSNDNPFSEAQFKTLKYRPEFPGRFGSIQEGRVFGQRFFSWYNNEHHHSGIAYLTPAQVHYGRAQEILDARHRVVTAAASQHRERFVHGLPKRIEAPSAVWINPPRKTLPLHDALQPAISLSAIPGAGTLETPASHQMRNDSVSLSLTRSAVPPVVLCLSKPRAGPLAPLLTTRPLNAKPRDVNRGASVNSEAVTSSRGRRVAPQSAGHANYSRLRTENIQLVLSPEPPLDEWIAPRRDPPA
jgi:putative transposase